MPNAPFLAPERDNAFKRGRAKGGATTYYSIPGVICTATSTTSIGPLTDVDLYAPFFADTPIVIDQAALEVTTLEAAKNLRAGIYAADTDWQPVGAPLLDSGNISTATTGVKTYTPGTPLLLPRGRYLEVFNTSMTTGSYRVWNGSFLGANLRTALGATSFTSVFSVTRAFAAFPTPGTAWDTTSGSNVNTEYPILLRVSKP